MEFPGPLIDKYQLAALLGLGDVTSGINRKCAAREWPHHMVLGKLRFSPEDVDGILLLCQAGRKPRKAAPEQPLRRTRTASGSPRRPDFGFADLRDRPIRNKGERRATPPPSEVNIPQARPERARRLVQAGKVPPPAPR